MGDQPEDVAAPVAEDTPLALTTEECLTIVSECVACVSGMHPGGDRKQSLEAYGIIDDGDTSQLRLTISGDPRCGVPHYHGFTIDPDLLSGIDKNWEVGKLADAIQDGAKPPP